MNAEVIIVKPLPVKEIQNFEKKVVYNAAVYTREFTKGSNAYPYLSGRLARSEIAAPILGSGTEYSLGAGVDYAVYVWDFKDAKWTNSATQPQWYYSIFKKEGNTIISEAVNKALKEVN